MLAFGHRPFRWVFLGICLAFSGVLPAQAQEIPAEEPTESPSPPVSNLAPLPLPEEPVFVLTAKNSKLEILEGSNRVIRTKNRITRISGFDSAIVKVLPIEESANQVLVQALVPGFTTIVVADDAGEVFQLDITVLGDVRELEAILRLAFPESNIRCTKVKQAVLLQGWVHQADQVTPILEIAQLHFSQVLNHLKVGGVQQVVLKVKIMEVQRQKIRQLGFNFLHLDENGYTAGTPGLIAPVDTITTSFGGAPSASVRASSLGALTGMFGITSNDFIFQGFIEALKQERLLKILAEPNLISINGQPANFLSGGEFPIPVPQSLGTVTIDWRNFGVQLEFVPTVLGEGRLRLDVKPEVSDQDPTTGVSLNGFTVPGLAIRRVQTQVEMNFGQTLIIAGLINTRDRAQTHKVPFLGELPWVGTAFRRVNYDSSETELLIMVTPELVAALDEAPTEGPGSTGEAPTDAELFLHGTIEVPKWGERCEDCEGTQVNYNGPVSTGPYPEPVPPPAHSEERLQELPPPPEEVKTKPRTTRVSPRINRRPGLITPGQVSDKDRVSPVVHRGSRRSGLASPGRNGR